MGWQKQSGGRVYDSLSGHGNFIDYRFEKGIDFRVLKKKCSTYESVNQIIDQIPPHKCNVNHAGSSGSMECALALSLTHKNQRHTIKLCLKLQIFGAKFQFYLQQRKN